MSISEIVDVVVTVESRTVAQAGFGTGLLLAYHTKWADSFRTYDADSLLDSLVDEGFATTDPLYQMAEAVLRQEPHFSSVMVGRAALPATAASYSLTVTPGLTVGESASVTVATGPQTTVGAHTLTGVEDSDDAATAIAALLDAASGTVASALANVVTVSTADKEFLCRFSALENVTVKAMSVDQGYVASLNALSAVSGGDEYYGVAVANNSEANIDAVAAWCQTQTKLFFSHYSGEVSDYTTWLATHASDALHRTYSQYTETESDSLYPALEAMAYFLAQEPGSCTLAFKELPGVSTSPLTSPQRLAIKAAKGNTYRTVGGANIIQDGWALSGRFMDITIAIDWLTARTRERAFGLIISKPKFPYTDKSVSQVVAEVQAVLDLATEPGRDVLRKDPAPRAWGPKVATVSLANRAARLLPDIKFTGELAGAIQGIQIRGTLSL